MLPVCQTDTLTFHTDVLKYLCLKYSHVPFFVTSAIRSVTGRALVHTTTLSSLLYSVCSVSLCCRLEMRMQWRWPKCSSKAITMHCPRRRFFLTCSLKLQTVKNKCILCRDTTCKESQHISVFPHSSPLVFGVILMCGRKLAKANVQSHSVCFQLHFLI